MALSGTRLAVTKRTAESWWLFSGPHLAGTNRTAESWWLFLANSWPEQIVLLSLGGSFWPRFGCNKSYCRVSVVLSGTRLTTNRTAESWWLFLAHVWPEQIVIPSLRGSFWPSLGRNKSYCRVSVALSGQLWPEQIVLPSLGDYFWPTLGRDKSHCRVSVALSGQLLAGTNRTAESRWLLLASSWPVTFSGQPSTVHIVLLSLGGFFWPTLGRNKSYCQVSVACSGTGLAVTNRTFCWPTFGRNKSYCRVSVALSGPRLAETNRTAESRWLALFWPTLGRTNTYCRILVALFWPTFGRHKSYCRVSVGRNKSYC